MTETKLLELRGITKAFPGVIALEKVNFDLHAGEIHCIVGGNGAGKSTLIKILSGMYPPTDGELLIEGTCYKELTPQMSRGLGIQTIYQETLLAQTLTVAENISLGDSMPGGALVNWGAMRRRAQEILDRLQVDIRPEQTVSSLGIAGKQTVQIAKALAVGAKVMIFDEPTASFGRNETEGLFEIIRTLKAEGVGIIYISHHMEEVFELADRITVFKDGRSVASYNASEVTMNRLVLDMVGDAGDAGLPRERRDLSGNEPVLRVNDLTGDGVKHATFTLKRGEILGIGGMVGAKRTELLRLIFGAGNITDGSITYRGETFVPRHPKQMMKKGFCLLTEDRGITGLFLNRTVRENMVASWYCKFGRFLATERGEKKLCRPEIERLKIKAKSTEQSMESLSGGNQQKVILAKWFLTKADIFLLDEPTRGIDIAAKSEIYRLLYTITESGSSVLCVSSDIPELVKLCDRVLIMRDGTLTGEATGDGIEEEAILTQIVGG